MKRPIVYLAATIKDLEDLRSATRFYLEERGFEVLDSKSHEFPMSRVDRTFDACSKTLEKANFFLLFTYASTNGTLEEAGRIHEARTEYRKANDLAIKGKLRIVTLVRAESSKPAAQVSGPENPESITSFLEEVRRNLESKSDTAGCGDSISENRIHEFRSFRDVVDLLEEEFIGERSRDHVWLKTFLRTEAFGILKQAMSCQGGTEASDSRNVFERFRTQMNIGQIRSIPGPLRVEWKLWHDFSSYVVSMIPLRFVTTAIVRVLESNLYLEFDRKTGRIVETRIYEAIERLKFEIDSFHRSNSPDAPRVLFRSERDRTDGKNDVLVDYDHLVLIMKAYAHVSNIIHLCRALLFHLNGGEFVMPALLPFTPLLESEKTLTDYFPSDDRVWEYVRASR